MHTQSTSYANAKFYFKLSGAFIGMLYRDISLNRRIHAITKTPAAILIFRFQGGTICKGNDLIHGYIIVVGTKTSPDIIRATGHHEKSSENKKTFEGIHFFHEKIRFEMQIKGHIHTSMLKN